MRRARPYKSYLAWRHRPVTEWRRCAGCGDSVVVQHGLYQYRDGRTIRIATAPNELPCPTCNPERFAELLAIEEGRAVTAAAAE